MFKARLNKQLSRYADLKKKPTGNTTATPLPEKGKENEENPVEVAEDSHKKAFFVDKSKATELFIFRRTLGVGTFGCVKLATFCKHLLPPNNPQRAIPSLVAIKVMEKALIVGSKQVDHINNERKILLKMHHPFTVECYGSFQDKNSLYLILDAVPGGEFFFYLRKIHRLSNNDARFYAAQICAVFDYLHSLNIIYRDLKPENILISKDGYLKLTDFGFAKVTQSRTYTLCGTPEYMAPEILLNKGHGKSVDWWTLGIFIYEMLVGRAPFYDEEPIGVYKKILAGIIIFPKDIDRDAKILIRKLLEADLTKRWGELARGIKDIKTCKWMAPINFQDLLKKRINPSYLPMLKGDQDFSNFEYYPDTAEPQEFEQGAFNPFVDW